MSEIGGYFGLEVSVPPLWKSKDLMCFSTGRACLMVILQELSPSKVYVPYYTCDATISPIEHLGIKYEFYSIDEELRIKDIPVLSEGEAILWTNYFGLMGDYELELKSKLSPNQLIIDDTHNLFGFYVDCYYRFTSLRKYFGIPNGAILNMPSRKYPDAQPSCKDRIDHLLNRAMGNVSVGLEQYRLHESMFDNSIEGMSEKSAELLSNIDFNAVSNQRTSNFNQLHKKLGKYNRLNLTNIWNAAFAYPFLPSRNLDRNLVYQHNIYPPQLWPDVLMRKELAPAIEKDLVENLLVLPIDHRYSSKHMNKISELLIKELGNSL